MLPGILAGLTAGALWGLIFLAPQALQTYSPSDIALGRYTVYGIISMAFLLYKIKPLRLFITLPILAQALFLSCLSCSLYYYLVAAAVRSVGIAPTSLIIGLLPVTLPVFSGDKIARPLVFYASIISICIGLLVLNLPVLSEILFPGAISVAQVEGTLLAFFALMSWTAYGLLNKKFLSKHPEIDLNSWSSMLGVGAFLTIIPFWCLENAGQQKTFVLDRFVEPSFILWMLILGAGSASLAMYLWNYASCKLPCSISGRLIVSETIFSLLYNYIYNQKLPVISEALASILLILGVIIGFYAFKETAQPLTKTIPLGIENPGYN